MKTHLPINQKQRIEYFLKGLPHLQLSETGLKNVAKKFRISIEELKGKIEEMNMASAFQSKE